MTRNTILRALATALVLTVATGCASSKNGAGTIHHLVLCWLNEPGNPAARAELIAASREFVDIPGVISVVTGPAVPSDRPVVDSSFDVAILIVLENEAALQAYLEHPKHKAAFRSTLQPLAAKVVVYDFVDSPSPGRATRSELP